jgi:hypothetical protein
MLLVLSLCFDCQQACGLRCWPAQPAEAQTHKRSALLVRWALVISNSPMRCDKFVAKYVGPQGMQPCFRDLLLETFLGLSAVSRREANTGL